MNALFPVIGYTHGSSYAVGNLITAMKCNCYMVPHTHLDEQHDAAAIQAVKSLGAKIWIKSEGGVGYQNMRAQLMLFKNSEIAGYVEGFVHADECNRDPGDPAYVSIATLLEQQQAWREVFPGKPDLLNLLINASTNAYAAGVMPKILGVDQYIKAKSDCSKISTFGDVSWSCARLLDAYTAAGMTEAAGYRLAFYFGVFKHNRCDSTFTSAGIPLYSAAFMDQYYQAVYGAWGSKFGAALFYAYKEDDAEDGYFPMSHPELWPTVQYLSSKIYNANLSSPYNVSAAPVTNDSVYILSFAYTRDIYGGLHDYVLVWETQNAVEVSIDGIGVVTGNSLGVSVMATRGFTLRATGADGTVVTQTISIVIGTTTFDAPTGLNAPPGIYTNSTLHIGLSNPTGNAITKLRTWSSVGGSLVVRGTSVIDTDAKGFTFTSDATIGEGTALFYIETNGVPEPHIEHYYYQVKRPYVANPALSGSVGGTLAVNMITGMGEQISGATSNNTGVATVAWSGGAATITLKAAGTASIVLTPTVIQGYNPADFKITLTVTVTAPVNETSGSGTAILTATGAVKLAGTTTATPPPSSLSNVTIAIWCYQEFENDLLDSSSTILADLGVNAIIFEMLSPNRTLTQVLNKIQAKGLTGYALCTRGGPDIEALSAGDLTGYGAMVDEVKTHPALRGYLISDEADKTGSGGATGDELRKANYAALVAKVHEHDPNHPTVNVSTARWASVSGAGATERAYSAEFLGYGDDILMYGNFPERETMSVITARNGEAMTKFGGKLGLFLPTWRDAAGVSYPIPSAQNMVDAAMGAKAFGARFELFAMWGWKDFNSPQMWSTIGDNATIYSNVKTAIAQIRAIW